MLAFSQEMTETTEMITTHLLKDSAVVATTRDAETAGNPGAKVTAMTEKTGEPNSLQFYRNQRFRH